MSISDNLEAIPVDQSGETKVHNIDFKGTTQEYFGIWIVNVLLSIVTFGVYSAWAKVRNKKYFSGVTYIDGHNFDYHATGGQIFIGRLMVFGFYIFLVVSQFIHIALYIVLLLLLLAGLGWIIKQAIRFNARMTSYRNVRFNFEGTAGGAWLRFVLYPFLLYLSAILIIGIFLVPFLTRSINRYSINNYRYGDRPFSFDSDIGPYYLGYMKMIGLMVLLIASIFGIGYLFRDAFAGFTSAGTPGAGALTVFYTLYGLFIFGFVAASLVYRVAVRNTIFNNAILDDKHEFVSTFGTPKYAFIIITNVLAVIFSMGLAMPWARVRIARYVADNTKVIAKGDLGGYTSAVIETHGVTAAEYADIEGFDIDLGIGF